MTNGDFIRSMTDEDITENFTRGICELIKSNVMFIARKQKMDGSKSAMGTWNNWTEKL